MCWDDGDGCGGFGAGNLLVHMGDVTVHLLGVSALGI